MKYKLTNETMITDSGILLHRIECLTSFGNVKAGDKGGWIESEINLSQDGECWVYDNAKVCGNAKVYGDALVYDDALVYGSAEVYGDAEVCGDVEVCGNAWVCGDAWVCENAKVYENAKVCGNAKVCENAFVYGNVNISGNAKVRYNDDYIVFKNWWSSGRYFTWTKSNNMWKVGCFYGTSEELIKKAYADSEKIGREYERVVKYVQSILED